MKKSLLYKFCLCFFICFSDTVTAQELFPNTEPASSVPKGVLGIKAFNETYKEASIHRNMSALRIMYGITAKLSIAIQASASNHHDSILPPDIVNHRHVGSQTLFYSQNRYYGVRYPYSFNGIYLYAKYRFLSYDGINKHFRMALYGEFSKVHAAHDEAEPTLAEDCSGWGAGLIITQLYKRFAVSFTTGYIKPKPYSEYSNFNRTTITYGNALTYNVSFGYRIYPKKYTGYNQDNYNIYIELMGKSYGQARLNINGENVIVESTSLMAGQYIESHFGIQRIINSNTRINISAGFPLISQSYVHFYPLYVIGVQHYFYLRKIKKAGRDTR